MGSSDLTLRSSNTKHKLISKTNYTSRYKLTLLSQLLTAEFRKQDLNKETPRTSFGALSVWTVTEVTRRASTQQHAQLVWPLCSLRLSKVQVDPTTSCSPASPASTSKMSLVFSLLMGTVVASAVVVLAIIFMVRSNRKEIKFEKRKTSHVTEVLQVDMIDRRLRSTSLITVLTWTS